MVNCFPDELESHRGVAVLSVNGCWGAVGLVEVHFFKGFFQIRCLDDDSIHVWCLEVLQKVLDAFAP